MLYNGGRHGRVSPLSRCCVCVVAELGLTTRLRRSVCGHSAPYGRPVSGGGLTSPGLRLVGVPTSILYSTFANWVKGFRTITARAHRQVADDRGRRRHDSLLSPQIAPGCTFVVPRGSRDPPRGRVAPRTSRCFSTECHRRSSAPGLRGRPLGARTWWRLANSTPPPAP